MTQAFPTTAETVMRSIIARIATGPELSKDISRDEARLGMQAVLDGAVDPVQSAIFLIALRMKRETDEETLGVLEALRDATVRVEAPVDDVLDLSDPYNGFNRTLPVSPFLPAVLAACGVATSSHGVETMAPKFGITHHRVFAALGLDVNLEPAAAALRLGPDGPGWCYVDQRQACPPLHALADLRTLMVKRPVLTTVEVLLRPISGRRRTHLMTGYVHKPYPRIYALLARHVGFDSALLVRGVEGGIVPSIRQAGRCVRYLDGAAEQPFDLDPGTLGIRGEVRAPPLPETLTAAGDPTDRVGLGVDPTAAARATAEAGREALQGAHGPMRDGLIYGAALALWHLGRADDVPAGAARARSAIDSGEALERLR